MSNFDIAKQNCPIFTVKEVSQLDNILSSDGNVTIVCDDEKGETAHKNKVGQHDNFLSIDGNVTNVCDDEEGETTHKNEVGQHDNILSIDGRW